MSRLDELIAEFCSEGVPFRAVGDVTARGANIKWANAGDEEFQYIDLTSVDRVTRKIGDTATITAKDAPSRAQQIVQTGDVIFATTRPTQMRWATIPSEFDGQIASTGYCVLRPDTSIVLTNFLAHILGADTFRQYIEANQVAGNYPSIPDSRVRAYRIPVPPLEVQREIVRILDQFAELKTELESELESELDARRRQYEHYRDSLLSFSADKEVSWNLLGDVGEFIRGRRFTKQDYVDDGGIPVIHYGEIYTHFGAKANSVRSHVRSEMADNLRFARPGDVILTDVGETVDDVGKAVAWLGSTDVAIHDHCYAFRHSMNPAFVSYYMQTNRFRVEKAKYVARTKVKTLLMNGLARVLIPCPPLDEQERVVNILDKFDAVVKDLSVSLPAEMAGRRQQYEHFRDRLLTFEGTTT